ncbi:MAG: CRISPR-associated endonuclease Cas2 [Deltaproteobacteria bacterium]|nr:CRISPR-associated endonuclease Cas2 [Deltaproteobacteria bacterium]RLB31357.1 MAG: CRISPR-associated endonuclease Cas2 [Deltaproteobacteria bacterium]
MLVVVSYDVSTVDPEGQRRLRRVAKACKDYGQRVQFSVFECEVDPARWTRLRRRLIDEIDPEVDSLRFYFLGSNWRRRVEQIGAKKSYDPDEPLIV